MILAMLAFPAPAAAGDLSIGLGYPYLSAKYDFQSVAAEARLVTGSGIQVYSGRGYWNFHRSRPLTAFAGAEAGYIKFDTLDMKGTGGMAALFVGGEYAVAENFSVLMDFAPTLIMLKHGVYDVGVSGVEYVVNMGFYYRFGGGTAKRPAPRAVRPPPQPAARPVKAAPPEPEAPPPPAAAPRPARTSSAAAARALADLDSQDWRVRRKGAWKLGDLKHAPAVEPLIQLLDDKSLAVRGVAALALGRIGDPRALLPLLLALEDESAYVRASAAEGLGGLKDKRALRELSGALKDRAAVVRKAAAKSIKEIGRR